MRERGKSNATVCPTWMLVVAGTNVLLGIVTTLTPAVVVTAMVTGDDEIPADVAVIDAEPALSRMIRPSVFTFTTVGAELEYERRAGDRPAGSRPGQSPSAVAVRPRRSSVWAR